VPDPGALGELRASEAGGGEGWPEGLVAIGGTLDPDRLVTAYRPHRSIGKSIRRAGWRFSCDRDFEAVMRACGESTELRPATWITDDFLRAYVELHRRGLAHSVEVWEGEELVGGLYGVTLGGFFGGESMFHRRTDASKAAVSFLVERLRAGGFTLLDAQVQTPHLERIGATTISRAEYLGRLRAALAIPARFREND